MTVTQLREVVRERGMSSPKAKTRKADIVASLLKTERPNMKRKQAEGEEEMGKTKCKSKGKMRKSLQENCEEDQAKNCEEDQARETNRSVWVVESQEFWPGGETAFKKELAFTSKEAALQGAKV